MTNSLCPIIHVHMYISSNLSVVFSCLISHIFQLYIFSMFFFQFLSAKETISYIIIFYSPGRGVRGRVGWLRRPPRPPRRGSPARGSRRTGRYGPWSTWAPAAGPPAPGYLWGHNNIYISPFKGSVQRDFHQSNPPGTLTNGIKKFRFWLRFCRGTQVLIL